MLSRLDVYFGAAASPMETALTIKCGSTGFSSPLSSVLLRSSGRPLNAIVGLTSGMVVGSSGGLC